MVDIIIVAQPGLSGCIVIFVAWRGLSQSLEILYFLPAAIHLDKLFIDCQFEIDQIFHIDFIGSILYFVDVDLREELVQWEFLQNLSVQIHVLFRIVLLPQRSPTPVELHHSVQTFQIGSCCVRFYIPLHEDLVTFL